MHQIRLLRWAWYAMGSILLLYVINASSLNLIEGACTCIWPVVHRTKLMYLPPETDSIDSTQRAVLHTRTSDSSINSGIGISHRVSII